MSSENWTAGLISRLAERMHAKAALNEPFIFGKDYGSKEQILQTILDARDSLCATLGADLPKAVAVELRQLAPGDPRAKV